jgi:hypothetical protein
VPARRRGEIHEEERFILKPFNKRFALGCAGILCALTVGTVAFASQGFGQATENQLEAHAARDFGIVQPLDASSQRSINATTANADPTRLATFAKRLKARVVAIVDNVPNIDMLSLWPNDATPQWIIACNEQVADNIGLIRINLATGESASIVSSGLTSCDPSHVTPWGTLVFGEEAGNSGRLFELIDPLNTTDVTVNPDGATSGATNPWCSK